MQQKDNNNPNNSLLSRLVVIALISVVIVVTILAGKKATTKQTGKPQKSSPQIITPTPSIAQKETIVEERCFITLNGKRYDVSDFRNEYQGEKVFLCGTDMTEQFQDESKTDLAMLEEYEVDDQGNFQNK